jgi:hypothetical protein
MRRRLQYQRIRRLADGIGALLAVVAALFAALRSL